MRERTSDDYDDEAEYNRDQMRIRRLSAHPDCTDPGHPGCNAPGCRDDEPTDARPE